MKKTMLISTLAFSTSLFANTQFADIQITQVTPAPELVAKASKALCKQQAQVSCEQNTHS